LLAIVPATPERNRRAARLGCTCSPLRANALAAPFHRISPLQPALQALLQLAPSRALISVFSMFLGAR
jgi:hypothetical protein